MPSKSYENIEPVALKKTADSPQNCSYVHLAVQDLRLQTPPTVGCSMSPGWTRHCLLSCGPSFLGSSDRTPRWFRVDDGLISTSLICVEFGLDTISTHQGTVNENAQNAVHCSPGKNKSHVQHLLLSVFTVMKVAYFQFLDKADFNAEGKRSKLPFESAETSNSNTSVMSALVIRNEFMNRTRSVTALFKTFLSFSPINPCKI